MNTTGEIEIVHKHDENWQTVIQMDAQFFPRPWKTGDWSSLDLQHHLLYTWRQGKTVVGFALFSAPHGDDTAHLLKILILPALQGSGESARFWEKIRTQLQQKQFRSVYLEVEEANARAQGFYQKQGFSLIRRVKSYYSDGAHAVMMQLTL